MTRIVVHGGMPKTGSSALQRWLLNHREELASVGVHYPEHNLDPNGVSSGNRDSLTRIKQDGSVVVDEDRIARTLADFEATGKDTLLLSSEFFGPQLHFLAPLMPAHTQWIVYLRDPVDYVESDYNQWVKRGRRTDTFVAPAIEPGRGIGYLDRILAQAGPDVDVTVRPYHPELFVGGNIAADLLHTAGIPELASGAPTMKRVNASYTLSALEYMRTANHLPDVPSGRLDRVLQSCTVGDSKYSLLTPEEYDALRTFSLQEIERLIRDFDQTSLKGFPEVLRNARQRPYRSQQLDREELAQVAAHVREKTPKVFQILQNIVAANPGVELPYEGFPEFEPAKKRWFRKKG